MLGLIHYNPHLPHQRDHARAFEAAGFKATTDPKREADIHVISGPHYAMRHWIGHPRVLMIDRAWWGDPECVSIGWLQPDGTRRFASGTEPRPHPEPMPWKTRQQSAVVLADYGQDVSSIVSKAKSRFHYVRVRKHPAEQAPGETLHSALALSDVAIGTARTALFDAIMMGLPSVCLDPDNPLAGVCANDLDSELVYPDRGPWLHDMSYRQFNLNEIEEAWRLLSDV